MCFHLISAVSWRASYCNYRMLTLLNRAWKQTMRDETEEIRWFTWNVS